jgi:hypothetical protein
MSGLHLALAEVGLALALLGAVWSLALVVLGRAPGRLYLVNLIWVMIVLVAAAGLGAVLLATESGVADALHLVYGVLAMIALPMAAAVGSGRPQRQQAVVGLGASVVLVILVLRLFQTGA